MRQPSFRFFACKNLYRGGAVAGVPAAGTFLFNTLLPVFAFLPVKIVIGSSWLADRRTIESSRCTSRL